MDDRTITTIAVPATHEDAVKSALLRLVPGTDFGAGLPLVSGPDVRQVRVRYQGRDQDIWFVDRFGRPPAPGGLWIDDLVAACCRLLFGTDRGTCRPVAGEPSVLEFRQWWDTPQTSKIHEDVTVTVEFADGRPDWRRPFHAQLAAYPGCDVAACVLASCYQNCEKIFGPGEIRYAPGKDHEILFRATGVMTGDTSVPFRFTIHRGGGTSGRATEMIVRLPIDVVRSWSAVMKAVGMECRGRFGPGRLSYLPECGETHFTWGPPT